MELVLPMCNSHPYFSLKNLGKTLQLYKTSKLLAVEVSLENLFQKKGQKMWEIGDRCFEFSNLTLLINMTKSQKSFISRYCGL